MRQGGMVVPHMPPSPPPLPGTGDKQGWVPLMGGAACGRSPSYPGGWKGWVQHPAPGWRGLLLHPPCFTASFGRGETEAGREAELTQGHLEGMAQPRAPPPAHLGCAVPPQSPPRRVGASHSQRGGQDHPRRCPCGGPQPCPDAGGVSPPAMHGGVFATAGCPPSLHHG